MNGCNKIVSWIFFFSCMISSCQCVCATFSWSCSQISFYFFTPPLFFFFGFCFLFCFFLMPFGVYRVWGLEFVELNLETFTKINYFTCYPAVLAVLVTSLCMPKSYKHIFKFLINLLWIHHLASEDIADSQRSSWKVPVFVDIFFCQILDHLIICHPLKWN